MNLIPRNQHRNRDPFMDLLDIQNHMNGLFDVSLSRWPDGNGLSQHGIALDIVDSKDHVTVKADLPGMKREDIHISIEDGLLTIKGEKKSENEIKDKQGLLRSERFYGMFERSISLPSGVDDAKVKASYRDGVLELTLPKKEDAKPRQIKIDVV